MPPALLDTKFKFSMCNIFHIFLRRTLDFGFADFSTANAFEHLLSDASYQASHPGMAAELKADVQKLRQRVDRGVKSQFSSQHGLMAPMSSTHHVNGG